MKTCRTKQDFINANTNTIARATARAAMHVARDHERGERIRVASVLASVSDGACVMPTQTGQKHCFTKLKHSMMDEIRASHGKTTNTSAWAEWDRHRFVSSARGRRCDASKEISRAFNGLGCCQPLWNYSDGRAIKKYAPRFERTCAEQHVARCLAPRSRLPVNSCSALC